MLKLLAIAFIVIFFSGCVHRYFHKNPQIESIIPAKQTFAWSKPWWEKRHQEKIEQVKHLDIDLLMLGDSIIQGWETEGQTVWHKFYKNRKAFNLGFNADRTENVLWRIKNGALDHLNPKLVVLMIGTNNTGHRMDIVEHTALGIRAIVKELRIRLPNSNILLLGIFPRSAFPFDEMRERNRLINQNIASLHNGKTIFYLNINDVFLHQNGSLNQVLMPDLLHPNELGYESWATAMEPTIKKLLY